MELSEMFWSASPEQLKQGYIYNAATEEYICLICGQKFLSGVIYPHNDLLLEASRFVQQHIIDEHGSVLDFLLGLDKKLTGLTDHQRSLIQLFAAGLTDQEVARELEAGSVSTIRNHRFLLRERQKQALIFYTIMEALEARLATGSRFVEIPRSARSVDERFAVTETEQDKILATYFKQGIDGPLARFPSKEKQRVVILRHILRRFEHAKKYSEKEVNDILKPIYEDHLLIRRLLIDYGFMDRKQDGSSYWLKT